MEVELEQAKKRWERDFECVHTKKRERYKENKFFFKVEYFIPLCSVEMYSVFTHTFIMAGGWSSLVTIYTQV